MGVLIDEFLSQRDVSPKTREHYLYKLKLLSQYLDRRAISLELLAQYPGWLRSQGYADASIQSTIAAARAYVRWAVERGLIASDCLRWRPRLRVSESVPKAISDEDAERMIAAAARADDRALLIMLRDTGARVGTLLALDVSDVDLGRKRAVVRQKGGRLVMLYLSERAVDALRVHLGDRRSGPVFGGGMGWVRSALRRCARAAGVTGRHNAHAWRHAFARRCVRSGLDLSRTARLLGHRSVTVTARYYAVWDGDELAEAHARVTGI